MKNLIFLILLILSCCYADDIIVKLIPEKVENNGSLLYLNISVENIPRKDSLNGDGGCGG